jgi:ribosomal protein S18 acetylase RimI-like enzyme
MILSLRPATADDVDWLDELHTRCMREHIERRYPFRPEQFRSTFDPAINHVIVVDGREVGLVSRWDEVDAIRVGNLLVEPEHQRRGIGTAVLRAILEEARSRGLGVRLRVLRGNPAITLYERLGFVVEEQLETAYLMRTDARFDSPTDHRDHSSHAA